MDVMVAPPARRRERRLHAVSIAGDFQEAARLDERPSKPSLQDRRRPPRPSPSRSGAAVPSAATEETMLSKAVESLVTTDVSDDDEDADAESARLKLLASLLRSGAKALQFNRCGSPAHGQRQSRWLHGERKRCKPGGAM